MSSLESSNSQPDRTVESGSSIADYIANFFVGKKVLILGFGREGHSTYDFLRAAFPTLDLTIADARPDFAEHDAVLRRDRVPCTGNSAVKIIAGPHYLDHLADYDIIVKTPGISFAKIDISAFRDKITSQLELLLEFSAAADLETIGITGTKGKSTTSSLIYQILQDQGIGSILLGNIGTPVFDHLYELKPGMKVVLEMSSHQLEFVRRSPHVALLLNVYEEHLDHYASFAQYVEAKCNIFRFQKSDDFFVYNADDANLQKFIHAPIAQTFRVSLAGDASCQTYLAGNDVYFENRAIYHRDAPRHLLGDYNLQNIMFALTVAEILGLDLEKARQTISEFKTLKHRLEFVREVNGVKYYDNSIGTVPMATITAVKALGNVDTVIIGGMDRGLDYREFAEFLNQSSVRNIICMPKTGHDLAGQLAPEKVHKVETLDEAVQVASVVTASGHSVLLSPAAASYGFFKNFEEKGDKFQIGRAHV